MKRFVICWLLLFTLGCEEAAKESVKKDAQEIAASTLPAVDVDVSELQPNLPESSIVKDNSMFQTIEWTELIPMADLDILQNPPEYLWDIEDGASADEVVSQYKNMRDAELDNENRYQQALMSTSIIEAMDGKDIRIPGFVVPVDFDDQQKVISFFLVPYFGACIHSPPPPPNQIIYVEVKVGFAHESLYDAVWVSGKISTELFEDPTATSAYVMQMDHIEAYVETAGEY